MTPTNTIDKEKTEPNFLWTNISIFILAAAIGICFASVAKLKDRIEALETPEVNPYKTQVLFKI